MAREITAGVLLKLKDQFSSQIKGAGVSVQGFADKATGMAEKVNKAFSGVAGTLGTLGVSIGALAAVNSTINLDERMVRLGLSANASAAEINELKRQIFETSQMPDIKLNTDSIISGLEVIMTQGGDLEFVRDNVRSIALAMQATGVSGDAMGAVFHEFAKFGYSVEEILPLLDDLVAQGGKGKFTFGEFAKNAAAVYTAYSNIGSSPEHIRKANAAMQILTAGTRSSQAAVRALNSTMEELSDPEKQRKLRNFFGINVRDSATGEFRDFSDIMFDIAAKAEKMGNADFFGTIFGNTSVQAIRAYMEHGERVRDNLIDLGDTAGLLQKQSEKMANTTKANLQNLQTAFSSFADKTLAGPIQNLTNSLNKLAEDPKKIETAIKSLTIALGALAAIRVGAGIVSFVASLNNLKSGGGLNMSGLSNAGGGAGIPVHVTNWGGAAGSSMMPGMGNAGIPGGTTPGALPGSPLQNAKSAVGNLTAKQYAGGAAAGGITAAIVKLPQMIGELEAIKKDETLTKKERGKAKGGAIGDATGSIVGAAAGGAAGIAAGAAVGAAVGSVVPVLGTAVGALVGAGIGALGMYLGGRAGRSIGAGIGGAVAGDDEDAARSPGVSRTNIAPGRRRRQSRQVNDLIVTPSGEFSTHPDDYIFAMKNPASLVNNEIHNEVRTVQFIPQAIPPVVVEGEIELKSELVIDDKGYRLRQQVGKNTTPYKFAVGSAINARPI